MSIFLDKQAFRRNKPHGQLATAAMKKRIGIAFLAVTVLLISLCSQSLVMTAHAESSNDDWPTFMHDSEHSGFSTSEAPLTNQTLWNFTTGGAVESSPVVSNGVVYVGSDDGYFYALNATTGALVWSYNTYGPVEEAATVLNGVVYVGGFHSHAVFAFNASTGALIWNSTIDSVGPHINSATVVSGGLVYISVWIYSSLSGGELYALNASTGEQVWTYRPIAWLQPNPAIASNLIYFMETWGTVDAIDTVSGNQSWSGGSNSPYGEGSVSIADGVLYAGSAAQVVNAMDAKTGQAIWKANIFGGVSESCPAVANGVLYVSSTIGGTSNSSGDFLNDGGVTALNLTTGNLLWNTTIGKISKSSPAVADGVVFVGSDGPNGFYALNATTGDIIWKYATGGQVLSSPAIANGVVYVGSNDGNVYAFGSPQSMESTQSPTPTQTLTPTLINSLTPSSLSPAPTVPELTCCIVTIFFILVTAVIVGAFHRRKN